MSAPSSLAEALLHYEVVIGLEVHAQLKTQSKLFSPAANVYDPDHPNAHVTPYCLGLPGVLPVLNQAVVEMAVRAGLALSCQIRERSVWSRKQYFYPDLPKGYQISQYDQPICEHGLLQIQGDDGQPRPIGITRIHIEEDAGKSVHVDGAPFSLVDYNRAGVPLIEIVSEPDLRSAQEASRYLKALRAVLMTLEVCDGNMEEGSFRCDANVSIRPRGTLPFGTRCELKNINSFRFVEQAIEFEIVRHARVLSEGGKIELETRLFDSAKKETRSMRSKEEAHDYRYFPDPDLPPLQLPAGLVARLQADLPELPAKKLERYLSLGVPEEAAQTFVEERDVALFFDQALVARPEVAVGLSHLIKGEVLRELKDQPAAIRDAKLKPADLAELVALREADRISSTQQKKLLQGLWRGEPLAQLLAAEGSQIDDEAALQAIVDEVIAGAPAEVEKFRSGKTQVMGFLVGQAMKKSGGKAKPPLLKALFEKKLNGG
jgi:aspartyl-tRNA(Asn)/glutamyl-tRNA(Gln) amidotransferase subunit B